MGTGRGIQNMLKKELQAELIRQLKSCDEILEHDIENSCEQTFAVGRRSGLVLALQLVERLEDGKA